MGSSFDKYKEAFLTEARAHLDTMESALLKLEKSPEHTQPLHAVFSAAHTLKSMAAAMGYLKISKLSHELEELLETIKHQEIALETVADLLFSCVDFLKMSIKEVENTNTELDPSELLIQMGSIQAQTQPKKTRNFRTLHQEPWVEMSIEKVKSIDVKIEKLDSLLKLTEELLVNKLKLDLIRDTLNAPDLSSATEILGRTIADLQYHVMQVRMISLSFIFNQFPRMVRDLARQQKKEVELVLEGGEIELDRAIIDGVSESLVHLIRNAIDHGIESPEERRQAGKPSSAVLTISASRLKNSVIIKIKDDGRGLDIEAIRSAGLKQGVLRAGEKEPFEKVLNLIFEGISTSKEVTAVSGRGLGLSIVKQKIESIEGNLRVTTHPDQGTTFFIEIPLSLAVLKALFVSVGKIMYAIPIMSIERLVLAHQTDLKPLLQGEALVLEGEEIPLRSLNDLFGVPGEAQARQPIVIVKRGNQRVGLRVDELLTTQEIVIKPLTKFVKDNHYFSGSTIIGSGEIVLVLDVLHLTQLPSKKQGFDSTSMEAHSGDRHGNEKAK